MITKGRKFITLTVIVIVAFLLFSMSYKKENNVKDKLIGNTENNQKNKPKLFISGNYSQIKVCKKNINEFLLLSSDGNALIISNIKGKTDTIVKNKKLLGNFTFDKNCKYIYYKIKDSNYRYVFKRKNILTKKTETLENIPQLTSINSFATSNDTLFYLDKKTLQVKGYCKGNNWNITDDDKKYYNIIPSPNNKYIIAHSVSNPYIFFKNGEMIKKLNSFIVTDWSKDGNYILGFKDISNDGKTISGSDIYVFNLKDNSFTKLTNTDTVFEAWPVFITNNEIIYSDLKSGNIYIKNIK